MATMRLNSQVRQFDGFTPGNEFTGERQKKPIWTIGNPFFGDFTNTIGAPEAKVHGVISVIHNIRQASLNADFSNKLSTTLHRRVGSTKSEEFFLWGTVSFIAENRKAKGEKKWSAPGIIIGRFWNKYALVHFRGSYLEVDIDDMKSANSLFELIWRDGALQLHIPSAKFPIHYLVDSKALIILSKMRNVI